MSKIETISDLYFMGWHIKDQQLDSLQVDDEALATGGYGNIYSVKTPLFNELTQNWVVKVCRSKDKVNDQGFRNMLELSVKLKAHINRNFNDSYHFLARFPAFIGFPQIIFGGEFKGDSVYCYLMPDLNELGFHLLGEILESADFENYHKGFYQKDELQRRFRCVYQISSVFNLLWSELKYLHGDIKAKSVWIHQSEPRAAIIDFDGGHFRQNRAAKLMNNIKKAVGFGPPIMGEIQEWLAPEILKNVNNKTDMAKLQVTEASDQWALGIGIYQILTGLSPLFFLEEHIYDSIRDYLNTFKWPEYNTEGPMFKEVEVLQIADNISKHLLSYKSIFSTLQKAINVGFVDKQARPSFADWKNLFSEVVNEKKPFFESKSKPERVLEGNKTILSWNSDAIQVYLDRFPLHQQGELEKDWSSIPIFKFVNEFGEWEMPAPLELIKKVVISDCRFVKEMVKLGESIHVRWSAQNVSDIKFIRQGRTEMVIGNEIEFVPQKNEKITIEFSSKYGLDTQAVELCPKVVCPIRINEFASDRVFTAETLPVNLVWAVDESNSVELIGIQQMLDPTGSIQLRPSKSIEYVLRAKNELFEECRTIYVEVIPIPKVNVKIPDVPKLSIKLPQTLSQVPDLLREQDRIRNKLRGIFNM